MSRRSLPLRRLQQWMSHVVQHPGTAADALAGRTARALVPAAAVEAGYVLVPNPRLSPAGMLDVYNGGYLMRLVEVLQSDFGAMHQVLGDDAFRRFAARYLEKHPSRHPNLNVLGGHVPAFTRTQRTLPHRAFLADLATLELSVSRAFDAPEFTPLAADAIAAVPQERWDRIRFTPNPSVQLLAFRYPADEFYQAWKNEKPVAVPKAKASWVLVNRQGDRVWRRRLSRSAFRVLQRLCAGEPLGHALSAAKPGEPVGDWFRDFSQDGVFTALRVGRG